MCDHSRKKNLHCLLLLTRNPFTSNTGRGLVLKTAIDALNTLNIKITIVHFSNEKASNSTYQIHSFESPSTFGIICSTLKAIFYRLPINESIYQDRSKLKRLKNLATEITPDFVYADMIRMAPYAKALNLPTILDLDDLLSIRYKNAVASNQQTGFGYLDSTIPPWIKDLFQTLNRRLLTRESKLLEPREFYYANRFSCCALVSSFEAEKFHNKYGITTLSLPMKITAKPGAASAQWRNRGLFVGTLNYGPNLQAFNFLVKEVLPEVRRLKGLEQFTLYVVGEMPSENVSVPNGDYELLGYVQDLSRSYQDSDVVFTPSFLPGGVKTKVIESMAHGRPTIANRNSVFGLKNVDSIIFLADSPKDWAKNVSEIKENYRSAQIRAEKGVKHIHDRFGEQAVLNNWRLAIKSLQLEDRSM